MTTSLPLLLPLPPGTSGLPIVGETGDWARDPLGFARLRHKRHGPIFRTHLLGRPCAVMLGPEANRFILGSHMHHFSSRAGWGKPITTLIGDGLSFLDGETHRQHRSLIQPALHARTIGRFFAEMVRIAGEHTALWIEQQRLRMFQGFKHLSFAIAARLILGLDGASAREVEPPFATFTRGLFAPPAWRVPGLPYHGAWIAGQQLRTRLREVVAAHRAAPHDTVLGMLIEARDEQGQGLSDAELVDELLVLLWAGHDTITSLMTWVIYELAQHEQIWEELVAEQHAVVGNGPLEPGHLRSFPLLDRVLRETERLHPPAPGGFRGVVESFDYGGYRVPAGWTVMYSSVFTHRMPELWHEPDRFDPSRFGPERNEGRKPFQLIGFGAGTRVCVGLAFAQMQMRIVLSHLLRHIRLGLVPRQRFDTVSVPTAMPRDGLLVDVRPGSGRRA
jgi:retinoid hydroxylase